MPAHPPGPSFPELYFIYRRCRREPIAIFQQLTERYGPTVRFRFRKFPDYLLTEIEDIEKVLSAPEDRMARSTPPSMKKLLGNGLLTSQGSFHRPQRKAIQPAFHKNKLRGLAATMIECAETCSRSWTNGGLVDLEPEMRRIALNIILRALFGESLERRQSEWADTIDYVQQVKSKNDHWLFSRLLDRLPLEHNRRYDRALARLDQLIQEMIVKRRAAPDAQPDFLSMLLDIQRSDAGAPWCTDRQIRDEIMTFFSAGHETLGNALTWTWYLLGGHPDAQQKVFEEADAVFKNHEFSDCADKLLYTRMVFREAMRLYPPVWIMGRRPTADFQLTRYTLPAGAFVHISPYLIHRAARYFEQPDEFRPERWAQPLSGPASYAYLPFGGGTRVCIGEEMAMMEGTLILATLARHWRVERKPGHPIEPSWRITLRPEFGMPMFVLKR